MRFKSQIIFCLIGLTFCLPLFAEELIIEPDMGRAPLLNTISSSKQSLHLVMYGFTDEALINAILNQAKQGKTLQIILEKTPYRQEKENQKIIRLLNIHHIDWKGELPSLRLIHEKVLISDNNKAIVMTFNFTKSAFKKERNFGVIVDDKSMVLAIKQLFTSDWQAQPPYLEHDHLVVSPINSRGKILAFLNEAKYSLKLYVQTLSDSQVIHSLNKAAKRGVNIQILTSRPLPKKYKKLLSAKNIHLRYSQRIYIHAKVIVVDHRKAMIGSINLTKPSLDDNRELAILIETPMIIQQLETTFSYDWNKIADKKRQVNWLYDEHTRWEALKMLGSFFYG